MKIRIGQLRRIIREVVISPSLKNTPRVDDPAQNKNIAQALQQLEQSFARALASQLVAANMDSHYDADTREFDDAAYKEIESTVKSLTSELVSNVKEAMNSAWKVAHGGPKSGVFRKAA